MTTFPNPKNPKTALPNRLLQKFQRTLGLSPRLLDTVVSVGLMSLEVLGALLDDGDVGGHLLLDGIRIGREVGI